jgi:hypothetical protein
MLYTISVTNLIHYGFSELEAKRAYHHFFFHRRRRGPKHKVEEHGQIEHVVQWILNIRQQRNLKRRPRGLDASLRQIDADVLTWPRAVDVRTLVQQHREEQGFLLYIICKPFFYSLQVFFTPKSLEKL